MSVVTMLTGQAVKYGDIRRAMVVSGSVPTYDMSLVGSAATVVVIAVNQGIDAHLEACFVPDRGDSYTVQGHRLVCEVSVESLPVLIRRLFDSIDEAAIMLAEDILLTLGFNEYGSWVGREALGLE